MIRFAPGPGMIRSSRIDSDFAFGSLVKTAFTARPEARSVTLANLLNIIGRRSGARSIISIG